MPRIANTTDALTADFLKRLEQLVETARREGHEAALSDVRALVGGEGGGSGARPAARRTAATRAGTRAAGKAAEPAPKKTRKNPWDSMTPAQRKERVRKMLAGRNLKPVSET